MDNKKAKARNRERIDITLDKAIIKFLRDKNEETDVPVARLIERAIKSYYQIDKEAKNYERI